MIILLHGTQQRGTYISSGKEAVAKATVVTSFNGQRITHFGGALYEQHL